jgi:hypothetical protein
MNKDNDSLPQQFSLFDVESGAIAEAAGESKAPPGKFSNFIVYVDESGDHSMSTIDPKYPVFVLSFCVFYKRHYSEKVVPALQKFKFNHFGHDLVVLHEREIRKEMGSFKFTGPDHRNDFINELTDIIDTSNFILISCVIDKTKLQARSANAENPYHTALGFCLETLHEFLEEKNQSGVKTHVVVERRGPKEDNELELEFRRICDGANRKGIQLPFDVIFAHKQVNSSGLQLADLVARPIGSNFIRPDQNNRAFRVLKQKFFCSGGRSNLGEGYLDWGLKVFPSP